ncbi:hypothetical protein JXD20_01810 [Candidatus Peregrinibacteria bacterium]|nr:hypothetical protein [Candidatus Peregrinibacteria bacterium]
MSYFEHEHYRPEAIPLPKTLREAFSSPSPMADFVSYSPRVGEKVGLRETHQKWRQIEKRISYWELNGTQRKERLKDLLREKLKKELAQKPVTEQEQFLDEKAEEELREWESVRFADQKIERPQLEAGNHAFYLGKFIPPTTREKIADFMGWERERRIYDKEAILAMIDYGIKHIRGFWYGQKGWHSNLQFVIIPALSRIFNDQVDDRRAIPAEEEAEMIRVLAKKHFRQTEVLVENAEEAPLHKDLFKTLKQAKESGELDIEGALGGLEDLTLSAQPSSLELARFLYAISKEYEVLDMAFEGTVPKAMNENPNAKYYGLCEVAVRLADILNGRSIHGGVERQEVYDQIIERLMKGKKGSYKKCAQLQPLFDLLEGKSFETIHLKTAENYYSLAAKRTLARARLALALTLGAAGVGGTYKAGVSYQQGVEEQRQKAMDAALEERVKNISFYYHSRYDTWHGVIDKSENLSIFNNLVKKCGQDLKNRYGIMPETFEKVEQVFKQYILDREDPNEMSKNDLERIDAVDRFAVANRLLLMEHDIDISRPYAEQIPHQRLFTEAVERPETEDRQVVITVKRDTSAFGANSFKDFEQAERNLKECAIEADVAYRVLGDYNRTCKVEGFYSVQSRIDEEPETVYVYKNPKTAETLLVTRDKEAEKRAEEKNREEAEKYCKEVSPERKMECIGTRLRIIQVFSTQKAKPIAKQWLYTQERFDALQLHRFYPQFTEMANASSLWNDGEYACQGQEFVTVTGKPESYSDFRGRFGYEYLLAPIYDEDKHTDFRCFLARIPGEEKYTYEIAEQLRRRFEDMRHRGTDYAKGDYSGDEPLNLNEIQGEADAILSWAVRVEDNLVLPDETKASINGIKFIYENVQEALDSYDDSYYKREDVRRTFISLLEAKELVAEQLENNGIDIPSNL